MIPSLSGDIDPMEANLHSRGSISVVHKLEVAAYSNHGLPPTVAELLPPPPSSSQASNKTLPLGTAISLPVDDVLARMSPNTPVEDALLDLYIMLSKAGSPLYCFDNIVGFMEKHAGHTFQKGVTLPHQENLIKKMQKKHNVPPPVPIPVVFENGTEGTPQYHHRCNEPVTVQAWPFEQMMQDHLLDPFMFGNKDNLVNGDNPWGKYVSSDPNNDKEVLASYWYSKTDNEYITAPDTQFLLCLEVYMDKTSKNAGLTSYAGEPFLLSVLHLKKSLREHLSAWFVQAYLPNLESVSSAKKQYSHRYLTRGMSNHNYHKIMDAVLEGIVATQKKGGFKVFIWMGSQCHLPDDSDTCPYFCRGRCQESRHTHLLLWWQELHSQGTQDVLVWQGGS
jgi:hypothetical protein